MHQTACMSTATAELASIAPDLHPKASLLMCPPHLYEVDYVINPWMAGNVHSASRARAAEQWQHLYEAVSEIIDVHLIEPQPGSPDMVFTANAGLEHNGIVAISSFFHTERQGEEPHFRDWFQRAGYKVIDVPRATPFEGEGDALFSSEGECLWVGHGPRTALMSHHGVASIWNIPVASLHLIDPRFYHLDTCFAPLSDGSVMYYPGAFDRVSLDKIENFYSSEKRVVVEESDAIGFACNAINLHQTIILNEVSSALRDTLKGRGFDIVEIPLGEFLKAGGAAKCLVMKLSGKGTHLD